MFQQVRIQSDYWLPDEEEHRHAAKTVNKYRKFLVYRLHRPFRRNFIACHHCGGVIGLKLRADLHILPGPLTGPLVTQRSFAVVAKLADAHA